MGWSIIGGEKYPSKCVVIAAPHTSNWDFLIGRCYGYIIGIRARYLIKSSLFIPVLGSLIKWNGGIPVFRESTNNLVDQIVNMFKTNDDFILALSPEGTRSRVDSWKSGFYHIATRAKVEILLVGLDFKDKKIGVINRLTPSGNFEKDICFIENQFKDFKGKIPDNYNPIIK